MNRSSLLTGMEEPVVLPALNLLMLRWVFFCMNSSRKTLEILQSAKLYRHVCCFKVCTRTWRSVPIRGVLHGISSRHHPHRPPPHCTNCKWYESVANGVSFLISWYCAYRGWGRGSNYTIRGSCFHHRENKLLLES